MFTEYEVDGGRADLIFLTRAGYLTEVEVKTNLHDWNVDQKKLKFRRERPHVSRFYYAIPQTLEKQIPDWLPGQAGILVVRERTYRDSVDEVRSAARVKSKKISDAQRHAMHASMYYRFWTAEIQRLTRTVRPYRAEGATNGS